MSARFFLLTALICAAIAVAGLLDVHAAQASDGCSWHENGQTVEIAGVKYVCRCERVQAINEVWCTLVRVGPAQIHRPRKPRLVVRYAIPSVVG